MKGREPYWAEAAKTLRELLDLMPDVKAERLRTMKPEDVQSLIQSWKPAKGLSYEKCESLRSQMAALQPQAFASVYEETRSQLGNS